MTCMTSKRKIVIICSMGPIGKHTMSLPSVTFTIYLIHVMCFLVSLFLTSKPSQNDMVISQAIVIPMGFILNQLACTPAYQETNVQLGLPFTPVYGHFHFMIPYAFQLATCIVPSLDLLCSSNLSFALVFRDAMLML
jgi:hypothetical protein